MRGSDLSGANPDKFTELDDHRFEGSAASALGALLHAPGAVLRRLAQGPGQRGLIASLLVGIMLLGAAYGAVVGLYQPGWQTLFAALKLPILLVATALLCAPTLYVFNAILGFRLSLTQCLALVVSVTAVAAVILVGLLPIAWFFTASAGGVPFLVALHVAAFAVAFGFGARFLALARDYLEHLGIARLHGGLLKLWVVLALVVGFQMAYVLRPLVTPGPFLTAERGLFFEALRGLGG